MLGDERRVRALRRHDVSSESGLVMQKLRILVIDADPVERTLLPAQLESEGHEVLAVSTEENRIRFVRPPHLILVDSVETLRRLNLGPRAKSIPVVAMVPTSTEASAAMFEGAIAAIVRPFGLGGVGRFLTTALTTWNAQRSCSSVPPFAIAG